MASASTFGKKGKTLKEAGVSAAEAKKLVEAGSIVAIGTRQTGQRGRPATVFAKVS